MTDAPPPATIVQILPFLFKMVNLREAPLLASKSAMYASWNKKVYRKIKSNTKGLICMNHKSTNKKKKFLNNSKLRNIGQ